ncbi:KTSC domain-containing protein [Acinetobacter baumannii]
MYRYFNVPSFVHEQRKSANSHGIYLNANIKDKYPFERA